MVDKAVTAVFKRIAECDCESVQCFWEDGTFVAIELSNSMFQIFQCDAGEEKVNSVLLCENGYEMLRKAFRVLEGES